MNSAESKAVSIDDCARRAMMGVGLPKPDMSDAERDQFSRKQFDALLKATNCILQDPTLRTRT